MTACKDAGVEPPVPGSILPDEVTAVGPLSVVSQTMIAVLASELNRLAVRYWLMGGWAVDGHLGRVTREHSDIDFAVYLDDRPSFVAAVAAHGYTPTPGAEPAGEFFAGGPRPLEVTYLVATPDGEVFTPGFQHWPYLTGSFGDERIDIAGVPVPIMSIEGLLDTKENWQHHIGEPPRPHDIADIDALRESRPDSPA